MEKKDQFEDEPMDEGKENAKEEQVPDKLLGQVLLDAHTSLESKKFDVGGSPKVVLARRKKSHKKLHSTLEMVQWKATNDVFDKQFEELLKNHKEHASP